jgi:hypothetical protein
MKNIFCGQVVLFAIIFLMAIVRAQQFQLVQTFSRSDCRRDPIFLHANMTSNCTSIDCTQVLPEHYSQMTCEPIRRTADTYAVIFFQDDMCDDWSNPSYWRAAGCFSELPHIFSAESRPTNSSLFFQFHPVDDLAILVQYTDSQCTRPDSTLRTIPLYTCLNENSRHFVLTRESAQ